MPFVPSQILWLHGRIVLFRTGETDSSEEASGPATALQFNELGGDPDAAVGDTIDPATETVSFI